MPEPNAQAARKASFSARRLLPLAVLIAGAAAFFLFGLDQYLSFDALRRERGALVAWVAANPRLAPVGYAVGYALATAFSLPIGAPLSLLAGFLFGLWVGVPVVAIGATVGAILVFLAARTALGEPLRARAGPALQKLEAGFRRNALSYMLFLRLIPAFPFWLVNLAPALLGVPLSTFALGTAIGVIPGVFVFVNVGRGLGAIFDAGGSLTIGAVLTADIIGALCLLAALALAPAFYQRIKRRGTSG
jgi:uncharacterized membrane protein YdjX (TVP38/TMEM64 family)